MKYEAWTARAVEDRVIEAAETLMLLPDVKGPSAYGCAMPAYVQDWNAYAAEPSRYKRRASREALDRMPETWGWINTFLDEADRRFLYAWAWIKARQGKKIADFASREGMNVRTLRRAVTRLCQRIANELNRNHAVRLNDHVDAVSENLVREAADIDAEVASDVKYATWWRAPDAKPRHLPERLEPIQRNPVQQRAG